MNFDFEKGYIRGTLLGDGTICKFKDRKWIREMIQLQVVDKEFAQLFLDCINKFCKKKYNLKNYKNLFKVTIYQKSDVKKIKDIFSLDSDNFFYKVGLMKGLFDSEGHISRDRYAINFTNTNKDLISIYEELCKYFNFKYKKKITRKETENLKELYVVVIIGYESVLKFREIIGITINRKEKILDFVFSTIRIIYPPAKIKCKICEKEFYVNNARKEKRKYCSFKCRSLDKELKEKQRLCQSKIWDEKRRCIKEVKIIYEPKI